MMTDKELLSSLIGDKIKECTAKDSLTFTPFLDIYEQAEAVRTAGKRRDISYLLWGGYEDSERNTIVFSANPDFSVSLFFSQPELSPVVQLEIMKDRFSVLSHRDYLGALMGLGIKREMIGDIVVSDSGCTVFVLKKMAPFICQNLTGVGKGTVIVRICDGFTLSGGSSTYKEKQCFVPSMRADAVVSEAFGISRSTAAEKIRRGEVFVNASQLYKPDSHIKENSKIVIHGKGKVLVGDEIQLTKKNRYTFKAKIF